MSEHGDFLTRIAARAVGDGARVERRLASRFEDAGDGGLVEQIAEMSAATIGGSAETWPTAVLYRAPPVPASRDAATVEPVRPALQDASPAPCAPDRVRENRTPIMAGVRTPTPPQAPPRAGRAPVEPRIVMLVPRADAVPMPGLRTPASARVAAPPAIPESGTARATTAASASTALPVANITIGRIDVRAPAAVRPPSPRAAAPPPLGNYLRGRNGAR